MAKIKQIHLVLKNEDNPSSPIQTNPHELYRVNIQAADDWVVTGDYRNNILCGVEIRRRTCERTEE